MITLSKTLAVFGATGQQGDSVLNHVLKDPVLSTQYNIRAITRDPSNPAATALENQGIAVMQADADGIRSLERALQAQGTAIADAAVAVGAKCLILSTLPNVTRISNGKYTHVHPFNAKAKVEDYIRTLPIKSAFYAPGSFMQNFVTALAPQLVDGTFVISGITSSGTKFPLIDPVADSGLYVGAILAQSEKYSGMVIYGVSELLSYDEIAKTLQRLSGKMVSGCLYFYYQNFGYYGPVTDEVVELAKGDARGSRTTFEEFLKNIHFQL